MENVFKRKIEDTEYRFQRVFYSEELCYTITYTEEGLIKTFKMKRGEDNVWKFSDSEIAPGLEMIFNQIIRLNEQDG